MRMATTQITSHFYILFFFNLGNDCIFVGNTISNMCYEATDTGAFYTGRSWIHRGNIIVNNVFQHIRASESVVLGSKSVQAIYLDDQVGGHGELLCSEPALQQTNS